MYVKVWVLKMYRSTCNGEYSKGVSCGRYKHYTSKYVTVWPPITRDYKESVTTGQTDWQTPDKVILLCRYASQATNKWEGHRVCFTVSYKSAILRIWILRSWRLWFGVWVLYFHRMLNITYPLGRLAFDIESKNRCSHDLGNLKQASNDNRNLQNCWCIECCFPVRSTFPELAILEIQMFFTELISTCPLSIHIKSITILYRLPIKF